MPAICERYLVAAYSREKGAAYEREVVKAVRAAGWPKAHRTSDGREQLGRGDIEEGPSGCHFECKRHERLSVPAAFRQVRRDARPLDIPILVHRPSREESMATLPLVALLKLLKAAQL